MTHPDWWYSDTGVRIVQNKHGYREILKNIGGGDFSQVYKVNKDIGGSVQIAALKVIDLNLLGTQYVTVHLPKVVEVVQDFKHPHSVDVFDIFQAGGRLFIGMKYAANKSVFDFLRAREDRGKAPKLEERLAGYWFNHIAQALLALHERYSMAHRNIKLENILLDSQLNAKLSDYGYAVRENSLCSEFLIGTKPYWSPEILNQIPYMPSKLDIWSFGVTLFAMSMGTLPFPSWNVNDITFRSEQKHRLYYEQPDYKKLSPLLRDLLAAMMYKDPDKRPTISQCLDHSWVKKYTQRPTPK